MFDLILRLDRNSDVLRAKVVGGLEAMEKQKTR